MELSKDFKPLPVDDSSVVTWIHLGDLHMVRSGEQNHKDLQAIVDEVNAIYAGKGVSFVFLPGDIADDGSERAYGAVLECLDRLHLPWCAIVGDHDVHEKSFVNFQHFMSESLFGSFTVGNVRFFRLNTFSEPRPDSFIVDNAQLDWLEEELKKCHEIPALLMHCYPSDLKQGRDRLASLIRECNVRVVDMGHTHYNEISNDGTTLYCATRSTGQIEEGPVGYSVLSFARNSFSWQFVRLGSAALVSIVTPSDERLVTKPGRGAPRPGDNLDVRARVWSARRIASVELRAFHCSVPHAFHSSVPMELSKNLWTATISGSNATEGEHELLVVATLSDGSTVEDRVRIFIGDGASLRERLEVDVDNALGQWLERDLLGTQLGPNKNGRKW